MKITSMKWKYILVIETMCIVAIRLIVKKTIIYGYFYFQTNMDNEAS